jgi:hypothetical protein
MWDGRTHRRTHGQADHYRAPAIWRGPNNYEVCTAVARCFPNILDVTVLENINLFQDKIGRPPLWYNETVVDFCHQSAT